MNLKFTLQICVRRSDPLAASVVGRDERLPVLLRVDVAPHLSPQHLLHQTSEYALGAKESVEDQLVTPEDGVSVSLDEIKWLIRVYSTTLTMAIIYLHDPRHQGEQLLHPRPELEIVSGEINGKKTGLNRVWAKSY